MKLKKNTSERIFNNNNFIENTNKLVPEMKVSLEQELYVLIVESVNRKILAFLLAFVSLIENSVEYH